MPAYVKLGESAMNLEIELPLFDESHSPTLGYQQIVQVIDRLLSEIVDPNMPFTSTDDFEKDCIYCPFQSICGTQWTRMSMNR